MPVQDSAESGEVVTLYFDGNPVNFGINDLAVALALFLNPNASTEQIQQVATDIFGLSLTQAQITGAGPNPLANFDLNGDGTPGLIGDLGVALGIFLGQSTAAGVDQVCQDVLGFSCDVSPSVALPGPGATPFPGSGTPSPASSVLVNTLVDENGSNPDACSLREAIIANNTNTDFGGCADPKGSIGFAPSLSGTIQLAGSSLPTIAANLNINGPGAATISISGSNQFRVFDIGAGSNVEIKGLTITDGKSLGVLDDICPNESGGGILVNGGTLTVRSTTLTKNVSTCGGSIAVLASGNLNVIDSIVSDSSTVYDSSSVDSSGGGIFIRSGSTVVIDNTTFLNNKAGVGGAISVGFIIDGSDNALVTINRSQFRNNSSTVGGAILNNGQLKIVGGSFRQNSAEEGGGAIAQGPNSKMTISNVEISSNSSDSSGGGILNGGSMTISDSIIRNNSSSFGGGINSDSFTVDDVLQPSTLVINNSTISNNSASTENTGGGILIDEPTSTATISGSTIQNNVAGFGGGIQVFEATLTISDSTVSGNQAIKGGGGIEQFKGSVTANGNKITGNSANGGGGIRNFDGLGKLTLTNNTFVPSNTPDNVRGGLGGGTGSGNNPAACNSGVCP